MSGFRFSQRSRDNLAHPHQDLVIVVAHALTITEIDFAVTEGGRTVARQERLVASGASQTMRSRHLVDQNGQCFAIDLAAYLDGEIRWDWPLYERLAEAMKAAARRFAIPIEWGGDWRTFKDGPHFQLPWEHYPGAY